MRILIAHRGKYPNIGGVAAYITQLKQGLESKGHQVDLLARTDSFFRFYLNNRNHEFDITKLYQNLKPNIKKRIENLGEIDAYFKQAEIDRYIYGEVASYFGLEKYDVIHAQDLQSAYALSFIKPEKTPLIGTVHGTPIYNKLLDEGLSYESKSWEFSKSYDREAANSSDQWILPSEWMKHFLINSYSVPEQKLSVVHHGIDLNLFNKKMEEQVTLPPSSNKTVIACPARLTEVKGHKYLFEALAKLKKDREDWICWLIGDGNLENELRKQVAELNLDEHVVFLGYQSNVPAVLKKSDIVVLASLQENQPYAVMEGQLAGKPVVATNVGGIPEMIAHNKTGLLSKGQNSNGLYVNLKKLLDDKELRDTLGSNAQKFAMKAWDLERMINDTISVYTKS
ncbi:glycosyltransferase family 4 protein [Pullulanibacillus sp. KACC 23026]|uniref:glycosyltransferase family 4 protein n=1 Tax=Pullulanibacillus sp. KACC 23026 TaxID=3028315 RepID=UPI0023AFC799|nr:glycosyltransferase family 4 protein [Pullulanibacillus sp. KACC 23026]WEG10997.1 glycosyltransferase family 4 protein [Pullulanibacillus sp. KACC 23026]